LFQQKIYPVIANHGATLEDSQDKFYECWNWVQSRPNAIMENSTTCQFTMAFNI